MLSRLLKRHRAQYVEFTISCPRVGVDNPYKGLVAKLLSIVAGILVSLQSDKLLPTMAAFDQKII